MDCVRFFNRVKIELHLNSERTTIRYANRQPENIDTDTPACRRSRY